jgi:hypothetical protein
MQILSKRKLKKELIKQEIKFYKKRIKLLNQDIVNARLSAKAQRNLLKMDKMIMTGGKKTEKDSGMHT